jgi:protein O-GlcNAc transferase
MELLKQTPESVLWLSKPSASAIENLRKHSLARGVDSSRIIFAERVGSRVDHLSRLRLADLFLDTPYFNAHTTAADALWAGVPVLTILGDTFAARVAASQLKALGMTELITDSLQSYQSKALHLAANPVLLKQIRDKLSENRLTQPLFNTKQYVQDLEKLYQDFVEKKSN